MLDRTTGFVVLPLVAVLAGCSVLQGTGADGGGTPRAERPGDSYLTSEDYREGEEIVDVFLTADDYGRMREDFEYGEVELDWGWVLGEMDGGEVRSIGFSSTTYHTVQLLPVENHSNALDPDIAGELESRLQAAMERLGLQVVSAAGDLELGAAIVDYKADRTYAYVAMIDPFVEIELRLRDGRTGETLLLVRDQEHGATVTEAAADFSSTVMQLLR